MASGFSLFGKDVKVKAIFWKILIIEINSFQKILTFLGHFRLFLDQIKLKMQFLGLNLVESEHIGLKIV